MRIKRLDILRCAAVLLVLSLHLHVSAFADRVGWAGVDLFFVLSGFLISGLLYLEYKNTNALNLWRFFVRRGLKIYPAFYAMIFVTFAVRHWLWRGAPVTLQSLVPELLFVQNYYRGVWDHTWSLAVEEHFYIGLALLLFLLARRSSCRANPFRGIPVIFACLAITCLTLRALTVWLLPDSLGRLPHPVYSRTYTRIDSLFFGVFLGYVYHFRPEVIRDAFERRYVRPLVAISSALLLSCCYFLPADHPLLMTFGLTFLYLGFGGLLVLCLETHNLLKGRTAALTKLLGTGCAYIGKHSYSIYLWHLPFIVLAPALVSKFVPVRVLVAILGPFCFFGSCVTGILFSNLVEFPILRIREHFFPLPRAAKQLASYTKPDLRLLSTAQKPVAFALLR
jgi:peptidoglycan/LPS O-acetylase OafA/YrhL